MVISSSSASPGITTIRTMPKTTIRIVAGIGVWVRGLTWRISPWAGKRESRAIAKMIREQVARVTIPAPKNAKTIATSRMRSTAGPS